MGAVLSEHSCHQLPAASNWQLAGAIPGDIPSELRSCGPEQVWPLHGLPPTEMCVVEILDVFTGEAH